MSNRCSDTRAKILRSPGDPSSSREAIDGLVRLSTKPSPMLRRTPKREDHHRAKKGNKHSTVASKEPQHHIEGAVSVLLSFF